MRLIEDGTYIVDVSEADLDQIKRVMLDTGKNCKLLYPDEERKRGKWIDPSEKGVYRFDNKAYAECSVCGKKEFLGWLKNFCPNCGSDMRGEKNG